MEIALHVHVLWRILSNISGYAGPIFTIVSPYESALCADDGSLPYFPISQGTLPWQPNHLWTLGSTWPKKLAYFLEYLRIYWTYFHSLFTIWTLCMCRWWICTIFSNISRDFAMATKSFVNIRYNTAKKWRILSNISGYTGPIITIFSPYESSLYTDDGSVLFYKFGQLPSSNLGVYAVKTCNFCRHAPAILGWSSYVTLAFQNGRKIAILISAE